MSEPEHQPVAPGPAPGGAEDPPPPNGRVGFLYVMIFLSLTCSMAAVYMLWETRSRRTQMIGDGRDIDTYRFDLSGLTVSRASLKASRMPRDSFEPINAPKVRDLAELRRLDEERPPGDYRREMVAKEVVVGVVVDGHARAYPLRILRWHEIVNDTLGDVPVAVTYDPLCDSIVVFDRRVGGETLSFGFSGLLHNSNLVLYDRRKQPVPHIELTDEQRKQPTDESLWSQLRFEVVAGPLVEGKH
ncbi:MAG: DUF3179 domain-containing protein, partial [Phycisphaerae bacterium]|nr:DUF3179 domain-containing protein [Phycisphaerae bacterium]